MLGSKNLHAKLLLEGYSKSCIDKVFLAHSEKEIEDMGAKVVHDLVSAEEYKEKMFEYLRLPLPERYFGTK